MQPCQRRAAQGYTTRRLFHFPYSSLTPPLNLTTLAPIFPRACDASMHSWDTPMPLRPIGLLATLALVILVASLAASAQSAVNIPKIGILHPGAPPTVGYLDLSARAA